MTTNFISSIDRGCRVWGHSIPAKDNDVAVILNPGDRVTINHAPVADGDAPDIVEGYTIVLDRRG